MQEFLISHRLAFDLIHSDYEIEKEYFVTVEGDLSANVIDKVNSS